MASVHKTKAGTYQVRWRDSANDQQSKNFKRSIDAKNHRAQVEVAMLDGTYVDPRKEKTPIGDYAKPSWTPDPI